MNPSPLLSPAQRRIVAACLTLLALVGGTALVAVAVEALGRLLAHFSAVLWPPAVAGVLALLLRPGVAALGARLRLGRPAAVTLLYAAVVAAAGGAVLLAAPAVLGQVVDLAAYLPGLWDRVTGHLQAHYPDWKALADRQLAGPAAQQLAETLAREAKGLATQALPSLRSAFGGVLAAATFLTSAAVVPVYLFFFLLSPGVSSRALAGQLTFLRPEVREDLAFLAGEFTGLVEAFFRGQLLIALGMGLLLALGFTLVGLKFGLALGLLLGALNLIPYLGSILGLAVAVPLAFFQGPDGGWRLVLLVLLVKALVQAVEGWFLTPRIMGRRTGLHPVAVIFAVFFWGTALGGLLGMLLAIPLTAFVVTVWRLARRKYFPALHAG